MGKVIYVDFRNEWGYVDECDVFDCLYIEILDAATGEIYIYDEEDMNDPIETESFHALSRMIDEWEPSDFIKRY